MGTIKHVNPHGNREGCSDGLPEIAIKESSFFNKSQFSNFLHKLQKYSNFLQQTPNVLNFPKQKPNFCRLSAIKPNPFGARRAQAILLSPPFRHPVASAGASGFCSALPTLPPFGKSRHHPCYEKYYGGKILGIDSKEKKLSICMRL